MSQPKEDEKWVIVHSGYEKVFVSSGWAVLRDRYEERPYKDKIYTRGLSQCQAQDYCDLLNRTRVGHELAKLGCKPEGCEYDYWNNTTPTHFGFMSEEQFEEIRNKKSNLVTSSSR